MENTASVEVTPQADSEYAAAIDHYLAETRRIREEMADDQKEIERLRAETRAMLAQLKAA